MRRHGAEAASVESEETYSDAFAMRLLNASISLLRFGPARFKVRIGGVKFIELSEPG